MKLLLPAFIILLASCRIERKIYSPLPVNNPSLQEKNDFSISASVSTPKGFDLNGGFAITDHIAVIGGVYTHKNKDIERTAGFTSHTDSSNLLYRHNGFTLGAGAFFPLGPRSSTFLSFYAGVNKGNFKMNEELYELLPNPSTTATVNFYKAKLDRFFLQGSLNYYGNDFEASTTIRYNLAEHKNVVTDYTNAQLSDYSLPPFVSQRKSSYIDFSMDGKFYISKNPKWGIHLFGLVSSRMNDDDDAATNTNYFYYPFRVGTGIFFRGFTSKSRK